MIAPDLARRAEMLRAEMASDDFTTARDAFERYTALVRAHPELRGRRFGKEPARPPSPAREVYDNYLQSPEWKQRREIALRKAGHRCQVCNRGARLEVHHRTYERFGAEMEDDLTVLCKTCHDLYHNARSDR